MNGIRYVSLCQAIIDTRYENQQGTSSGWKSGLYTTSSQAISSALDGGRQ
jgi:hypothetical protein